MTRKQIARKRDTLMRRLKTLQSQIQALQSKTCQHPAVEREAKADTGNWDPGQDSYWYACKCPDCGKIWTEDQ